MKHNHKNNKQFATAYSSQNEFSGKHYTCPTFFDDCLRLVCKANMQQASLSIGRDSNDGSLWVLNEEVQNKPLEARELFGFNVGSFQELPAGDLFAIWFSNQHPKMPQLSKISFVFPSCRIPSSFFPVSH